MRGKERESEREIERVGVREIERVGVREIERVGVRKGFNVRSDHASEFELNFDKICLRRTFWKPKAKKRLRSTFKINQRKSWVAFSALTALFYSHTLHLH